MSDQQENIDAMEEAEEARRFMAAAHPFINASLGAITFELIRHYRSAQISHDYVVGKLGEMSALHSLVGQMDTAMRRGETAAEREYGDGKKKEAGLRGASFGPRPGYG